MRLPRALEIETVDRANAPLSPFARRRASTFFKPLPVFVNRCCIGVAIRRTSTHDIWRIEDDGHEPLMWKVFRGCPEVDVIVSLCGIQIVLRDAILRRMLATPETACRIREVQHTRTWWHVETKDIGEHISVVRDTGRHNRARVRHLFDHTLHIGAFGR